MRVFLIIYICMIFGSSQIGAVFSDFDRSYSYTFASTENEFVLRATEHYDTDYQFALYVYDLCLELSIPYYVFMELIQVECEFRPRRSPTGAVGYCQITTIAVADVKRVYGYELNRHDELENVRIGALYFKALLEVYKLPIRRALIWYNAGNCKQLRQRGERYADRILNNKLEV